MEILTEIAQIVSGQILQFHEERLIQHLIVDTRKVISPQTSLFFAIRGVNHNGHVFLQDAYRKGIRQFIIEEPLNVKMLAGSNIIQVASSVDALQRIGEYHRLKFHIPIWGIAGSNAKTIIKEWLAQLFSKSEIVVKNPRSYNSQVGVPLSVWEINPRHTMGIFEAGISMPHEMEKLERVIHPTLGLFTNIGSAHDEGFKDRHQKIAEKLKLFKNVSVLFFCRDHQDIEKGITKDMPSANVFSWSRFDKQADVYVKKVEKKLPGSRISIHHRGKKYFFFLAFSDDASIENAIHCISILLYHEIEFSEIQNGLSALHSISMRLELKEAINGCYLIDDTYNNDLAGLSMALNFLDQQNQRPIKTIILSDLFESGLDEEVLYPTIANMVKEKTHRVIGIGPLMKKYKLFFNGDEFYDDTESFLKSYDLKNFSKEIILIKGARIFKFEKIAEALQQKVHGTVLRINLDALSHNLNFYRSLIKPSTKVMVMVKAFAYGSGSHEVASLLQFHRVDYLGVAYADEGVSLRENGISLPIMVMNPTSESFSKLTDYDLEPEIYSFRLLEEYKSYLSTQQACSKIHIKIDTGMRRLGFEISDLPLLINKLTSSTFLNVESVFTHLAAADEKKYETFTLEQLNKFETAADEMEKGLGKKVIRHALNSAGIVRYSGLQMDMVRLGIGLYGIDAAQLKQDRLLPVGTLTSVISQIKYVKDGETVGYSRNGVITRDSFIATVPIGYADGYSRRFGNGIGAMWVNGTLCPTVGNVCMDMTMIDISATTAQEGDEVVIFGKEMPLSSLASSIQTIPYEILTGVSERVRRVFYTE